MLIKRKKAGFAIPLMLTIAFVLLAGVFFLFFIYNLTFIGRIVNQGDLTDLADLKEAQDEEKPNFDYGFWITVSIIFLTFLLVVILVSAIIKENKKKKIALQSQLDRSPPTQDLIRMNKQILSKLSNVQEKQRINDKTKN